MKRKIVSKLAAFTLAAVLAVTGAAPKAVYAGLGDEVLTEKSVSAEAEEAAEEESIFEEVEETEQKESTEMDESGEEEFKSANSFSNMQCGENVYATLENGTLTISGTGKMWNADANKPLFSGYMPSIRELVITDGVTYIGSYAFSAWRMTAYLEKMTLADSIEEIGYGAFFYQSSLRRLVCPANLKQIDGAAFYGCRGLQSVVFNDGLERLCGETFYFVNQIKEVVLPEGCVYSDSDFVAGIKIHQKTTVTLNANGGTVNGAPSAKIIQYEKEAYGNPQALPTPVRDGYEFLGWYDYTDGIEGNAAANGSVRFHAVLLAKWCDHSNTILKNERSATYDQDGYTGDTYCAYCDKCLSLGVSIPRKRLEAPRMSAVENVKSGLKVRWMDSLDAEGYYVYRKNGGAYQKIAEVKTNSYIDTSVKAATGRTYSYKVCAYYGTATSNLTGAKSQVRVASPTLRTVKSQTRKKLTVNWKKVAGCNGYQLQYSKDRNFKKSVTTKTIKASSQTTKSLTNVSRGKRCYVRVRSYKVVKNKKYYSAWSSAKSAVVK